MKKLIKKGNDQGVAMIVALIVGVVIMAFCLSMLLVTYTLFAQTSRQTTQLQCKILAQSFDETLKEEFKKDPDDSAIVKYLGDKISDGSWVSMDESDDDVLPGMTKEVVLTFDDRSVSNHPGYSVYTTFTYESNESDDSDDGDDGNIDDDQDDTEDTPEGPGSGDDIPVAGSYLIHAKVYCVKDNSVDRDTQSYTIEGIYSVTIENN